VSEAFCDRYGCHFDPMPGNGSLLPVSLELVDQALGRSDVSAYRASALKALREGRLADACAVLAEIPIFEDGPMVCLGCLTGDELDGIRASGDECQEGAAA
jgi:hypothetical protein